ncbi:DUF481 domain-containing protein [Sphingomonas quercus]|uniref:DUF481 domain-containing protein n=1 Tax=Sphingomonas quercus TaxID=2842451 RepID=A0ABS6BNG8_9SPHN|nr:DUF481 domain-containing protein [Sphingomonas quercus]MBU3079407.1 DUF481 domain-containing protein [Sphingomonas quercus]
MKSSPIAAALLCATLVCAASPADAAKRPVRRSARQRVATPPPPPPIPVVWAQAPQPAPLPILIVAPPEPPAPPVVIAAPPTVALPDAVKALLAEAAKTDDPAILASVAKVARAANPQNAGQIDAVVAQNDAKLAEEKARAAREKADRLASAAFLDLLKGEVELGASLAAGNSNYLGLYSAVSLTREGLKWRHSFSGRVDYQRTDGTTTTERATAAWQPQYKIDDRLYIFGLAQYEHDRFLGYDLRLTSGAGLGYTLVNRPGLKIDVTGGPALRYTRGFETEDRRTVAGRGSLAVRWTIAPGISFSQDAAVFYEEEDSNATATTSLDTKLIGALKARLSYNITFEQDSPDTRKKVDTLSRATLVYAF